MSNGQDNRWLIYVAGFGFISVLIIFAILFKILPLVGLGMFFFGLFLIYYASHTNDDSAGMWGIIFLIGGIVVFFIGIVAYDFLEEIGVVDFLKQIFGKT